MDPNFFAGRMKLRRYRVFGPVDGVFVAQCPVCREARALKWEWYRGGTWLRCVNGCERERILRHVGLA